MLRSVVTPGARSAAAICFSPAFFVAPEGCTRPESGPLARTRNRVTAKRLPTGVLRIALLDERRDRLAHVVRPQCDGLRLGFHDQAVCNRNPARGFDRALRALYRERRRGRDPVGERGGFGIECVVVHETLAQTDAVRLVGVDACRGPDELLRLARAHDARQALRAAEVGEDAVLVLEQTDRRAAREDADVARER